MARARNSESTPGRREEILAAALECFNEKGYEGTTLDEIRVKSGASVGSIYHFFGGKDEIAGALYVAGLTNYQRGFSEAVAGVTTAEVAVRRAVWFYLDWVVRNPQMAKYLLNTRQAELLESSREQVRSLNRAFFRGLKERVEPEMKSGTLRAMPWEIFTAIVMGPAHEYARLWTGGLSRTHPGDVVELLSDAAWESVQARDSTRRAPRG